MNRLMVSLIIMKVVMFFNADISKDNDANDNDNANGNHNIDDNTNINTTITTNNFTCNHHETLAITIMIIFPMTTPIIAKTNNTSKSIRNS